ncbi:MAG: TIGR00730 family Rossman fold protein [Alphaproteobacteria bacterium]|nr:TIGR00730 family Rossman fold protein [Alphaproteobacteria bacterium]
MSNYNTLTVYLGSSGHARPVFKQAAEELGRLIAQRGKRLVYGGMDAGLMGIIASTALAHGAHVTGIIPQKLKDSERILTNLSETILVQDLWERKRLLFTHADAVLALPGGFGTLDESLEVLYWGDLGLHNKPLVLVNIEGYWDGLVSYLKTLPDFDPRFLVVADSPEDALHKLDDWQPLPSVPVPEHFPHFEDEISRATDQPILVDKASVENTYYLVCALGLKQLGKHIRAIGILNENGAFDGLLAWFEKAAEETFITQKCLTLYDAAPTRDELNRLLAAQKPAHIDLHKEKWGEPPAPKDA